MCFSERQCPGLRSLAGVHDDGLKLIKPETMRGRRRFQALVSDGFIVFQKSCKAWTDLASMESLRTYGSLTIFERIAHRPLWGKRLPRLVREATQAKQSSMKSLPRVRLSSCALTSKLIWLGNELAVERGGILGIGGRERQLESGTRSKGRLERDGQPSLRFHSLSRARYASERSSDPSP